MIRLQKLQSFLEQDPSDSLTRYMIGLEYAKERNFTEAIRTLEELRSREPGYVPTYLMLGGYYREMDEKEKAKAVFEDGISRARAANDLHAASELAAAFDELIDE